MNSMEDNLLFEGIQNENLVHVKFALESGASIDAEKGNTGLRPIHYAAQNIKTDIAKFLIARGADIHVSNQHGYQPIHRTASNNTTDVAQLLIQHGADINAINVDGYTPLHLAIAYANIVMVKFLLENNADYTIKCNEECTPLDLARSKGNLEISGLIESYIKSKEEGNILSSVITERSDSKQDLKF